jgi:hypothetical protein
VYTCPSSPSANERVEQYPSEDDMSSVNPSFDLISVSDGKNQAEGTIYQVRSEKVAKCKLLTTHSGTVC